MFQRQWFAASDQSGLTPASQEFESCVRDRKYAHARSIISRLSESAFDDYWTRQSVRLRHLVGRSNHKRNTLTNLKVFWECFWPDFNSYDNQILDYFRYSSPDLVFETTEDHRCADIVVTSCYGNSTIKPDQAPGLRILFLGENVRPSFSSFDLSLSFDICSYLGRNIHFPLWLLEIDVFNRNKPYPDRVVHPVSSFTSASNIDLGQRIPAIAFIGNNCEPFRYNLLNLLSSKGIPVDYYGSSHRPVRDKFDLLSRYRLTLAFENSYYPGYITEKSLQAYISKTPALFWGCDMPGHFISRNSLFHNVHTHDDPASVIRMVSSLLECDSNLAISPLFDQSFVENHVHRILRSLNECFNQFR
jgi:hypothetical protein